MLKSIFSINRKLLIASVTVLALSCSAHDVKTGESAKVVSPESYEGHICNYCTTYEQFREIAYNRAPGIDCEDASTCWPLAPKNFFITNPKTGAYKMLHAKRSTFAPHAISVYEKEFPGPEKASYEALNEFYILWKNYIRDLPPITAANVPGLQMGVYADSCPTNTALATVIDSSKMSDLLIKARLEITLGIKDYQTGRLNEIAAHGPEKNDNTWALNFHGVNSTIKEPSAGVTYPYYIATFDEMERSSPLSDNLTFKVEFRGINPHNQAVVSLDLDPGSSTVGGGYTLSQLAGQYGALRITDPCVLAKLDQLKTLGGVSSTPIGGGGGNPGGGTNPPNGGGDTGGNGQYCTYTFRQSGYPDMTWIAPCD
ncbi:hypothetical protein SG34_004095 [Thalassomonas viridans]|uniref:Lipoprotein n=1 Tax=Thalassomonas viridans TaxID=137584 RepID=A0AAF0CAB5_9GAMM|nr:hypothetical protein [Thalassomonas viridans]WDE06120.1 hypothetical protein SG34_004095 [Thalassomonas viridans]